MNVQIASIKPEYHEGHGVYRFKITIVADGQSQSFPTDPEKLLDFHEFRATVASHTGHLLGAEMAAAWESELQRLWEKPAPRS